MKKIEYHILVVDDSPTFTRIIGDLILHNTNNTNIRIANSGMEAIRILGNNQIDLILLDVFMPIYDGLEMAKIIRNNPKTSKIPIIFITGSDPEQEFKEKALEVGGIDYINKSLIETELARLINLYLRFINWEKNINVKLQDKITELNQEIEKRIKIEKALVKATKELAEANNTKDKFFSIIAHDLKNPLSAFKNLAEVLSSDYKEMGEEELEQYLSLLNDSSSNLYSLLENLLVWARTQTGSLKANIAKFNIFDVVADIFDIVNNSALDKKISINYNFDNSLEVFADENMISTVIRNLVTNAIKFTHFEGKIDILAEKIDNKVRIKIKDSGVGMSEEDISKLFVAGGTKSKLGTNKEKGTGLGLVICSEFVQLNNSKLNVKSELNVGTEFYFDLQLAE